MPRHGLQSKQNFRDVVFFFLAARYQLIANRIDLYRALAGGFAPPPPSAESRFPAPIRTQLLQTTEARREGSFNGKRSVELAVFRVGDQTPTGVSEKVREALPEIEASLPPGIAIEINRDRSLYYQQRLDLLLKNAGLGLALVVLLLAMFLEYRLALWVALVPCLYLAIEDFKRRPNTTL